MNDLKEKVTNYFIGKGWFNKNSNKKILHLRLLDDEYNKLPIVIEGLERVRYIVVGERTAADDKSGATHYIARDVKIKSHE